MQISELKLAKDLIRKPSITPKDAGAINLLAKNLRSLGFNCKKSKKDLKIEIPSWRPDINQDVDLIEELIRIKGFKNIKLIEPQKNENKKH